jgi:hypothetical protein
MIDALWFRLLGWAERIRREERGDSLVNWVVLAVVAILRPALENAAQSIANFISGG